jgi:hypothetical protein
MKATRTRRPTALLVGLGLAAGLLASCTVERENTTPETLPPDFGRELVREAEEAQQQIYHDAEELAEMFEEDDGLTVIGIP